MTEHIASPLERWLQFNLSLVGYALETQAQLGKTYLAAFETVIARDDGGATSGGPSLPEPREPVIPKQLPPLIRAQWMLGMLFAGWQLPEADAAG